MDTARLTSEVFSTLKQALSSSPPVGTSRADVESFFARNVAVLLGLLASLADNVSAELIAGQPIQHVTGLSSADELALVKVFQASFEQGARARPGQPSDERPERATELVNKVFRALIQQRTTLRPHEPGQAGYAEERTGSSTGPIRRWFRLNSDAILAMARAALANPVSKEALQIRLKRNMASSIKGFGMLPRGSTWNVLAESRPGGGMLYGWDIKPPKQGVHVIPLDDAEIVKGSDGVPPATAFDSYYDWRIFSDDGGVVWAVKGLEHKSASSVREVHLAVDDFIAASEEEEEEDLPEVRRPFWSTAASRGMLVEGEDEPEEDVEWDGDDEWDEDESIPWKPHAAPDEPRDRLDTTVRERDELPSSLAAERALVLMSYLSASTQTVRWVFRGSPDIRLAFRRKDRRHLSHADIREISQSSNPSWLKEFESRTFDSQVAAEAAALEVGQRITQVVVHQQLKSV